MEGMPGSHVKKKKILRRVVEKKHSNRGFTIIEVIAALILMVIITAVAVSRFTSTDYYDVRTEAKIIKGYLRYAQARAMNTDLVWGIHFRDDNTSLVLFQDGDVTNEVLLPDQSATVVSLPDGMTVTAGIVSFDTWGVPYTDQGATSGNEQSGTRSLTLASGGTSETITIVQNTGFVE